MTITVPASTTQPSTTPPDAPETHRSAVTVEAVTQRTGGVDTLQPCSFSIAVGEVVGIAGGSGAGKTTLLETIAGVRRPASGTVRHAVSSALVPQDDVIHRELPLRRTLLHAAALRLDATEAERGATVDRVLDVVDLADRADVAVGELSGGQRKRASLAAELLTDPRLLFLDEPTSGLDPAISAELMDSLRDLAGTGSTVVITTHSPADLRRCDRVVFVATGGHVVFAGTPTEALAHFGVDDLADVYGRLAEPQTVPPNEAEASTDRDPRPGTVRSIGRVGDGVPRRRQWAGLVRRDIGLIATNRLTLAIMLGSPVFIISMMTMLFPAGSFDDADSVAMAVQTLFWLAFNSFFFGLTYGLLQVVGEFEIIRHERWSGLSIGAYIASKLTVLVPLLAIVNLAQVVAMETFGRLPAMTMAERVAVFVSLQLLSVAAVAIGLHASSAVQNPAQATLALPMLCFPQVLFAGAVVPVSSMGAVAEAMSLPLAVRWGFEPLGRILDLGPQAALEPGTAGFAEAFSGGPGLGWSVLVGLAAVATIGAWRTLVRRTATV